MEQDRSGRSAGRTAGSRRTAENDTPVVAFLSPDEIWYAGGALVQNSMTLLGATPTEWCEPEGPETL